MTRTELERKYETCGCENYQLRSLEDLKAIHEIDVTEFPGYQELSEEHQNLFDTAILRFFNAHGLDSRKELKPKSIHYVYEVEYVKCANDGEYLVVGGEIYAIDKSGNITERRLRRYRFEKGIPFKECEISVKNYLRFELKNEWYYILDDAQWY